jgi:NADH-ubiquinone oxidoreductase chain 5
VSTVGVIFFPLDLGSKAVKRFDQGWSEFFGAENIYFSIKQLSTINQIIQNNNLKIYLIIFVFWLIFLVLLIIF